MTLSQYFCIKPSPSDIVRFIAPLATYRALHELILLNQFSEDDLKTMLLIELNQGRRTWMVRRLCQHIIRVQYAHIKTLSCASLGCTVESLFS